MKTKSKKVLVISESDFSRVVPWRLLFIPGLPYFSDAMILGHTGEIEYQYHRPENLPRRYRKLLCQK